MKEAFSVTEVAIHTGLSRPGVFWYVHEKGIECMRTGTGRLFFTAEQLQAFQERLALTKRGSRRLSANSQTVS